MIKGMYVKENSTAKTCTEVACITESESCTSSIMKVETVKVTMENGRMDDGKEARRHITMSTLALIPLL